MLKKLLGDKGDHRSKKSDLADLEHLLAEIALETPQIEWIALMESDGVFVSSFSPRSRVEKDRVSAMGAAMSALGERIAFELKDGELQYILVAGTSGISVTIQLSPDYLLVIGLNKQTSIEEFLKRMQETRLPLLLKIIHMEGVPRLSGIQ